MTVAEIARRWTIGVIAEVLGTSIGVIEALLPYRPAWAARIKMLESRLRAVAGSSDQMDPRSAPAAEAAELPIDPVALLTSHAILHETLNDIKARGLSLDDGLVQRMTSDWSAESIVTYLQAADAQLRTSVAEALTRAAAPLSTDMPEKLSGTGDTRRVRA